MQTKHRQTVISFAGEPGEQRHKVMGPKHAGGIFPKDGVQVTRNYMEITVNY